jgi:hypothetical protein
MKSALAGFNAELTKVVDIGVGQLQKSASDALEGIYTLLQGLPLEAGDFRVDEIRFTMRIDATGEVSIVSVAKGSLGAQAGVEVKISRHSTERPS